MNNTLKIAVVAAGSFVAGYFASNMKNESFYMDQAQREIDRARDDYKERMNKFVAQRNQREDDLEEIREAAASRLKNMGLLSDEDEEIREASEALMDAEAAEALSSYQGNGGFVPVDIHAVDAPPMIQYSDYMSPPEESVQQEPSVKPTVEVLTSTEYTDNPVDYEDSTLIYYAADDVLVGGRIGEGRVGETLRAQMLGDKSDVLKRPEFWEKEEFWYFRNHALKYNFEIMREEGKYVDEESPGGDG